MPDDALALLLQALTDDRCHRRLIERLRPVWREGPEHGGAWSGGAPPPAAPVPSAMVMAHYLQG